LAGVTVGNPEGVKRERKRHQNEKRCRKTNKIGGGQHFRKDLLGRAKKGCIESTALAKVGVIRVEKKGVEINSSLRLGRGVTF